MVEGPDATLDMPVEFDIPAGASSRVQTFFSEFPLPRIASQKSSNSARQPRAWSITPVSSSSTSRKGTQLVFDAVVDRRQTVHGAPGVRPAEHRDRRSARIVRSCSRSCPAAVSTHRADVGKRIPAGKYLNWQMHYNPTGKPEKDCSRLGLWFNKAPVTHELLIRQAGDPLATDKAGLSLYRAEGKEVDYKADAGSTRRCAHDAEHSALRGELAPDRHHAGNRRHHAHAMSPHMHLRGKSLKWVITYPDGREETILDVPNFDFNWQFNYELAGAAAYSRRQQDPGSGRLRTTH